MTWMVNSDPQKFELYDMISDPYQRYDISMEKPGIVASMKQEMTALWREMRDEGMRGKN